MRVILGTQYLPMTYESVQMIAIKMSSTGKIAPLTNCDASIMPIKFNPGIRMISADKQITKVKIPLKIGASFHVKETPASHPKASQITNAVVSGRTHAANKLAATNPAAKRASA